jgi:hypothetical protein
MEIHPEADAAVASNLKYTGVQLFSDSDFDNYWAAGSLE